MLQTIVCKIWKTWRYQTIFIKFYPRPLSSIASCEFTLPALGCAFLLFLFKVLNVSNLKTVDLCLGFPPGYGLRTEMIRKFFPFLLWKRFRKYRIPERFFPVNLKFLDRCFKIMERPGILFRKIPVHGKGSRKMLKSS